MIESTGDLLFLLVSDDFVLPTIYGLRHCKAKVSYKYVDLIGFTSIAQLI